MDRVVKVKVHPEDTADDRVAEVPLRKSSTFSTQSGTTTVAGSSTKTLLKKRRCQVSLRVLLIAFSTSMAALVVIACVVPTSVLWRTSLGSMSDVARRSTSEHLDTYRALVTSSVSSRLVSLLLSPIMVAELVAKVVAPLPLLQNGRNLQGDLEAKFQELMVPLYSERYWPYIWSTQVGYQNADGCQHLYRRVLDRSVNTFGVWDQCHNTTMVFYRFDGDTPTHSYYSSVKVPKLDTRAWWSSPHTPALMRDNASWCPPFWSITPGEGKMITVSYAFPGYDRSGAFPVSMVAMSVDALNIFLATMNYSANSWVLLVEGESYNMVAASREKYIPAQNATCPAMSSPYPEVRAAVGGWIDAGRPDGVEIDGEVLVDTVALAVPGGGIALRLFLVTPRSDFVGQIEHENEQQLRTARSTMIVVVTSEMAILLLALAASALISVRLARPLQVIKDQLFNVGNMDFEHVLSRSGSMSMISEVSKLQSEAFRMGVALASFSKYVPRTVVKDLLRRQLFAEVGVHRTNATIFFLDIVNFTHTMDTRGAVVVIEVLRTMFERFSAIITTNNGTIDKYIGDSIMAVWGCPEKVDEPITDACRALSQILDALVEINSDLKQRYDLTMAIRVGMHYGEVHAGNVGSSDRLNYTVLGNSVNLAARLEPLNKELGTTALVTDAIRQGAGPDFAWRCLGAVQIRGFAEPVRVHEFLGVAAELPPEQRRMLVAYESLDGALCSGTGTDLPDALLIEYVEQFPKDQGLNLVRKVHRRETSVTY
eukprot:TRINITY_DN1691_c0_g1_i1.p1 TRINITY_DN1691_c0_g1~~TRINITY_DN1691_c0_g1_i1.p1  ORF type:complete len:767 (+),score=175.77 TRINITY_DN1691_c0_g1_i1:508-2808(+)